MEEGGEMIGFRGTPGELYRPANGAEGMDFMENFCCKCEKYEDCLILAATMAWPINHPDYPREWLYVPDGLPTCTAFKEEK